MSDTLLSLDLGTNMGWAVRTKTGAVSSGTVSFKPSRFDGGGMRYLRFSQWLDKIHHRTGPITVIWFEEVRMHAGTDAAHVYGGMLGTLTSWAELHRIPYEGTPVGTIKKHVTGKGNASKADVIAAMRALGYAPADHNEADALALLYLRMIELEECGSEASIKSMAFQKGDCYN